MMQDQTESSDASLHNNKKQKTSHDDSGSSPGDVQKEISSQHRCTLCGFEKLKAHFISNWSEGVDPFLKGMCRPCTDKLYGRKTTTLSCLNCERMLMPSSSTDDAWFWNRLLRRPYPNVLSNSCSDCVRDSQRNRAVLRSDTRRPNRSNSGALVDTDEEEDVDEMPTQQAATTRITSTEDGHHHHQQVRLESRALVDTDDEEESLLREGSQQQQRQQQRKCGTCHQMKSSSGFSTAQWNLMTGVERLRDEYNHHKERHQEHPTYGHVQNVAFYSYPYTFYDGKCMTCLPLKREFQVSIDENWKRDKAFVLGLHKEYGVGTYDFRPLLRTDEQSLSYILERAPSNVLDMVGMYDVVLFREKTEGQDDGDICSQRAAIREGISLGVLELVSSANEEDDVEDYEQFLQGTLEIPSSPAWGNLPVETCQVSFTNRSCTNGRLLSGSVDEPDNERFDNMRLSIFRQPVVLGWIPCDDVPASSTYAKKLREELQRPQPSHWLWLCNKCNIPETVSQAIMEFGRSRPNPTFEVKAGDLFMTINFEHYSCSSQVQLVARRRRQQSPPEELSDEEESGDDEEESAEEEEWTDADET